MWAQRLYRPAKAETKPLRYEEIPVPLPGFGQVRIRVEACGVCHTDLHIVEGDIHPPRFPIIPGHQVVGVIDEVGDGVKALKEGMRIGVPWVYRTCGACDFCRSGQENLCPNAIFTGFHVDGGFQEMMLADEPATLILPESLSSMEAAPLLCAGIIGYRSLKMANLHPGERLGLVGFGASAHLAIQIAKYWDCEVYVFTRTLGHQKHALELGATWAGDISGDPPHLADRAVIFAPAGELVPLALSKLRPGGSLAINAIQMSPIPSFNYALIYGERSVCSVANATHQDGIDLLKLAGDIPLRATVQLYSLADANEALIDLKQSRINGEAVLH